MRTGVHQRARGLMWAVAGLLSLAVLLPTLANASWPVYGHDLANSRNAGSEGPSPSQVATLKQAWSFNSPTGDFTGTPVVAGGVLVAGDYGGVVYALDAVSGKKLWSRALGQPINGSAAIDRKAAGGATVFVPVDQANSPRLVALSLKNGAVRWDRVLTRQSTAAVFGSPTFWHGSVYMGTSGPEGDRSTARGSVVALSESSGQLRWQTFTASPGHDGAAVWSTPAVDTRSGRLYVGTGNNYHPPDTDSEDAILSLDAASGRILGHYQATANDSFSPDNPAGPDADFGASPNLVTSRSGQQLVAEGEKSGAYWAVDRASMKLVWQTSMGPGSPAGGIVGSTAYDGSRIYGADSLTGQVSALGRDGSVVWQSFDSPGAHWGSSSVAHGVLYTMDPVGLLTARDPGTGMILAKLPLGGPSLGGISAVGRALYAAVGTGPPPEPLPQQEGKGSIVAFGDTSRSGSGSPGHGGGAVGSAAGFNGSCQFSGTLAFRPPLTNSARRTSPANAVIDADQHRRVGKGHARGLSKRAPACRQPHAEHPETRIKMTTHRNPAWLAPALGLSEVGFSSAVTAAERAVDLLRAQSGRRSAASAGQAFEPR